MEIYDSNVADHLGIAQEINTLPEIDALHEKFIELRTKWKMETWLGYMPHYRSEQCYGWDIIPGVFRGAGSKYPAQQGKVLERDAALDFKMQVENTMGKAALRHLFDHKKYGPDWDLLFQAQHAGVKTTLVDWTAHIQRSVYFAVEQHPDPAIEKADAQLWVFMVPYEMMKNEGAMDDFYEIDPMTTDKGYLINVSVYLDDLDQRVFESRIARQGGRFFISAASECNVALNKQDIAKYFYRFRIPAASKVVIREQLNTRGVNRESVYVTENPAHQAVIDDINKRIYI